VDTAGLVVVLVLHLLLEVLAAGLGLAHQQLEQQVRLDKDLLAAIHRVGVQTIRLVAAAGLLRLVVALRIHQQAEQMVALDYLHPLRVHL
jgi:hypothetical protein